MQSVPFAFLKRLSASESPKKPNIYVGHEFFARLNEVNTIIDEERKQR